jgi:hypothetical protein
LAASVLPPIGARHRFIHGAQVPAAMDTTGLKDALGLTSFPDFSDTETLSKAMREGNMNAKLKVAAALAMTAMLAGCAIPKQEPTSVATGCYPYTVAISDLSYGENDSKRMSDDTWTAACDNKTYKCKQAKGGKVECTRGAEKKNLADKSSSPITVKDLGLGPKPCGVSERIAATAFYAKVSGRRPLGQLLEDVDNQETEMSAPYPNIARDIVRTGYSAGSAAEAKAEAMSYCLLMADQAQ